MGYKKKKVLILEDKLDYLKSLANELRSEFDISLTSSLSDLQKISFNEIDIALLDIRLNDSDPSNIEGINILEFIKKENPELPVVMMTAYGDIDIAVESMKLGASDFIQKNKVNISDIKNIIYNHIEKSKLKKKISELEVELQRLEPWKIIGSSPNIQEIKRLVEMVASDGYVTVLLRGPTGTGKELVARTIHSKGVRKDWPFVPVSIASLSKNLVESEIFGHEKGAFTGAEKRKVGYIEKAKGGILFLDEIGELDPEVQVKLLRFLDNKTFHRMGSPDEINIDLQLIAATNHDLEEAVQRKQFREDLYFRLKTIQIFLPTLHERTEDILQLANYFLRHFQLQGRTKISTISTEATRILLSYSWPGNVRELKSCIERAIIYAEYNSHDQILPEDLPLEIQLDKLKDLRSISIEIPEKGVNINEELAQFELAYIERALKLVGGKKADAWKVLGYNDRHAMRRRIEKIVKKNQNVLDKFPLLKKLYGFIILNKNKKYRK